MKVFRKMTIIFLVLAIIIIPLTSFKLQTITASSNIDIRKPIKIGVLFYNFEDPYFSLLIKSLESIQKENENKVEFTFFDGKTNVATQNQLIDNMVSDNFDLLILNMDEPKESVVEDIINKIKLKNIPVVLFASTIPNLDILKTYSRVAYIFFTFKDISFYRNIPVLPKKLKLHSGSNMKICFQGSCYQIPFISIDLFADLHPEFFTVVCIFILNVAIYINRKIQQAFIINRLNSISDYSKIRFCHT